MMGEIHSFLSVFVSIHLKRPLQTNEDSVKATPIYEVPTFPSLPH
jgi:hypothetical protein